MFINKLAIYDKQAKKLVHKYFCLFQTLLVVFEDYLRTEFVCVLHITCSPNNSEFTLLTQDNKLNTISLPMKRNFELLKH